MLGLAVPGGHSQVWQKLRLGKRRKFAVVEIGAVPGGLEMGKPIGRATVTQFMTTHSFCGICLSGDGNGLIPRLLILRSQFHRQKARKDSSTPAGLKKRSRESGGGRGICAACALQFHCATSWPNSRQRAARRFAGRGNRSWCSGRMVRSWPRIECGRGRPHDSRSGDRRYKAANMQLRGHGTRIRDSGRRIGGGWNERKD